MSNQYLKLRRSALSGKIPETSSLDFGEIALNTFDGLAFMKKSGSNGEEIIAIGTGTSGNISGSDYYIPVFSGSTSLITSSIFQSGSFTSIRQTTTPSDPINPDILLVDGGGVDTHNIVSARSERNGYIQLNVQNNNGSTEASSDIVATANNGTETDFYIDMGINSEGYTNVGNVGGANDAYVYSTGNDLYIGNASTGRQVIIFNGGLDAENNANIWIHDQGTVGINTGAYNTNNIPSVQIEALNSDNYNVVQIYGETDNYSQVAITNRNGGTSASSDLALYNDLDPTNQLQGYVDLGINSSNYAYNGIYPGSTGDAYLFTDSHHLIIGSLSGSAEAKVTIFAGGISEAENAKLIVRGVNNHELTGSLDVSGSVTAQTFTGSLFGTASWAENAISSSYALTASYALSVSGTIENATTASYALTSSNVLGGATNYLALWSGSTSLSSSIIYQNGSLLGINNPTPNRTLDLISLQSGSYVSVASFIAPNNNIVGNTTQFYLGAQQSPGNSISWTFNYQGNNSVANRMGFEFNGYATPVLSMFRNGNSVFGGSVDNGFKHDVQGTGRYTNNLTVTGSVTATLGFTGSLFGTASWAENAITASYALNVSGTIENAVSASFAQTASYVINSISSSYAFTASSAISSSYAYTASSAISSSQAQTASYVLNAISSSYAFTASSAISSSLAQTASYVLNAISSSYAFTASSAISSSQSLTASYVLNAISASYAFTASSAISASQAQTASYVLNAISASYAFTASSAINSFTAISSSNAMTASSADNFVVRNSLTASNALINGTITAQTLVVQTVSSSVVYSSGSNIFGNSLTNTQEFTGSVSVTGSLSVNGSNVVLSNQTGSMSVLSASFAQTASYVPASGVVGLNLSRIATGSVSASVNLGTAAFSVVSSSLDLLTSYNNGALNHGTQSLASGKGSHAEGFYVTASGDYSHAEGTGTKAIILGAHAEGSSTIASGYWSHAEGVQTISFGDFSHAEGAQTSASKDYSHAEGQVTVASGIASHAEGSNTIARGVSAHAEGYYTVALGDYSHTQGQYNISSSIQSSFIIGNGISDIDRRNLVFAAGNTVQITGSLQVSGSISGSLFGTASYALNVSGTVNNAISASYAFTASSAISSSFAVTASYILNAVSSSYAYTASSAISSSYALTASYAANASSFPFTGSAIITGSLTVTGSTNVQLLNIGSSQFNNTSSITSTGTTIVSVLPTSSYTSCFYNYTIASGSNARSGQVMSVWNGATIRYTEVATMDIGNTAIASFAVALSGANVQLSFSAPGVWTVKNISNLL